MTTQAPPTLTYRGDPDLKAGLVAEAEQHRAQDRLIRGTYVQLNGTWRGCAVGCTVAGRLTQDQLIDLTGEDSGTDWHQLWAETTGCPEWLAHVEDNIFEGLPIEAAREWPVRFLTAIPVGADLTAAREAWLRDLIFDSEHGALALAAAALESAGAAGDAARLAGVTLSPDWSTDLTAQAARLREIPPTAAWESAGDAASLLVSELRELDPDGFDLTSLSIDSRGELKVQVGSEAEAEPFLAVMSDAEWTRDKTYPPDDGWYQRYRFGRWAGTDVLLCVCHRLPDPEDVPEDGESRG